MRGDINDADVASMNLGSRLHSARVPPPRVRLLETGRLIIEARKRLGVRELDYLILKSRLVVVTIDAEFVSEAHRRLGKGRRL